MNQDLSECWREFELQPGVWGHWRIGPIDVGARPLEDEWRFAWRRSGSHLDDDLSWTPAWESEPTEDFQMSRFVLDKPGCKLSLRPRLADRAIVFRLETRLYILPGEEAGLFVSSPVWLAFTAPGNQSLLEVASWRPSDTWFGESTTAGEICYASLTSARTAIDQLRRLRHRAVTPIKVRNQGEDALLIGQLRLPVPMLSLYGSADGQLWTDPVVFERPAGEEAATFRVREKSRHLPQKVKTVAAPRQSIPRRRVVEALGRLLQ